MASFPKCNFSSWWNIHDSRASHSASNCRNIFPHGTYGDGRSLVADWGRTGAVDILGRQHTRSQFDSGTLQITARLDGHPYPLCTEPNRLETDTLPGLAEVNSLRKNVVQTVLRLRKYSDRTKLNRLLGKFSKAVETDDLVEMTRMASFLPSNLRTYLAGEWRYLEHSYLTSAMQKTNSSYSNCLAVLKDTDSSLHLASLGGPQMKSVICRKFDFTRRQLAPCTNNHHMFSSSDEGQSVLGINTCQSGTGMLLRHPTAITALLPDSKTSRLTFDFPLYSASANPFISSEYCVTGEDEFRLMSADLPTSPPLASRSIFPRSTLEDVWSWAEVMGHPRQFLYADRSQLLLLDVRCPEERQTDLFALPSKLLNHIERVYHCSQPRVPGWEDAVSPYCLLATDYNCLLVDRRMPGIPVLQWTPALLRPASYSHWIRSDCSIDRVVLGTQAHREAFLAPLSLRDSDGSLPAQMTGPCLAAADLGRGLIAVDQLGYELPFAQDRLECDTCLLGLAGLEVPGEERLLVVRLTDRGDVIMQEVALGGEDEGKSLADMALQRLQTWLGNLNTQCNQQTTPQNIQTLDPATVPTTSKQYLNDSLLINTVNTIDPSLHAMRPRLIFCRYCRSNPEPFILQPTANISNLPICEECGVAPRYSNHNNILVTTGDDRRAFVDWYPWSSKKYELTQSSQLKLIEGVWTREVWGGDNEEETAVKSLLGKRDKEFALKDNIFTLLCAYRGRRKQQQHGMQRVDLDASSTSASATSTVSNTREGSPILRGVDLDASSTSASVTSTVSNTREGSPILPKACFISPERIRRNSVSSVVSLVKEEEEYGTISGGRGLSPYRRPPPPPGFASPRMLPPSPLSSPASSHLSPKNIFFSPRRGLATATINNASPRAHLKRKHPSCMTDIIPGFATPTVSKWDADL